MTQSHVLILQHVPWEKPGRILDSLDDLGMSYEVMNIAKEKKPDLPDFSDVSGIVIMGGPMGALDTDKYPGLKAESKLVRAAVSVGKPLLGVCLGHQIIATALGAKLKKGSEPEIGFAPIKRIDKHDYFSMWNKTLDVLHWQNHVVTLPEGAQPLAKSAKTKNQAFRVGFGARPGIPPARPPPTLLDERLDEPCMVKRFEGRRRFEIAATRRLRRIQSAAAADGRSGFSGLRAGAAPMPQRWSADKRSARYTPH